MTYQENKRQKILDAASQLFRTAHDMRKVSLEDIARKAGVSPTTIYNYFGTREMLVGEVAKELTSMIGRRVGDIMRSDLPFDKKLVAAIAGKVDTASQIDNEIIARMISQDKQMAPFIEEIYRTQFRPMWLEFLRQGKLQGYIDPSLDDEALLVFMEMVRSGLTNLPEMKDYRSHMEIIQKLTGFIFYGFLKKDIELFPRNVAKKNKKANIKKVSQEGESS